MGNLLPHEQQRLFAHQFSHQLFLRHIGEGVIVKIVWALVAIGLQQGKQIVAACAVLGRDGDDVVKTAEFFYLLFAGFQRGIHQHVLHRAFGDNAGDAAAGRLRLLGHNSDFFTHKVVGQAGFAHVGPPHQRHKDTAGHFRNRFCHSVVRLSVLNWKIGR